MAKTRVGRKRHILKTVTWRIIGTLDTLFLGWIVSGSLRVGAAIGGLEMITKLVLYYLHERVWYGVDYGTDRVCEKSPDDSKKILS